MSNKIFAWHFLRDNGMTRGCTYPDGKVIETVCPPLEMCRHGLHASRRIIDALDYAEGSICRRVMLSGEIVEGDDKLVATERRELWRVDATKVLHLVACRIAEDALRGEIKAGRKVDQRSHKAIQIKKAWLTGKATNVELDTARAAARAAAWAAARAAAGAAARAAARDAAWAAAKDAAKAAAWDAAWDAARDAARVAALDKYNQWIENAVNRAHKRNE